MEEDKIVIYQTEDGQTQIDVRLENDTVWLNTNQMSILFDREESNIRRHIINVFKEGELVKENNVHFLHVNGVKKPVPFYTLDVIISVGYRVKSHRGVRFRQWANKILKDYLVKGYAVNKRIHKEQIGELRQLVGMLGRTIQNQPLMTDDETNALFEVVTDYTYALDTLDNYDYERLTIDKTTQEDKFQAAALSLATRKTSPSKAASDRSIRPLEARNSTRAWRRKPPCYSIWSRRTTRSATATNALLPRSSYGS